MKGFFFQSVDGAEKYSRLKLGARIGSSLISFASVLLVTAGGISTSLEKAARGSTGGEYSALLLFAVLLGIILALPLLPVAVWSGYILEHRYGLSNQSLLKYLWEQVKAGLVGAAVGLPLLLVFYFILSRYPTVWWLVIGCCMVLFSILLTVVFPIVILPLFYKVKPVRDVLLLDMIARLAGKAGMTLTAVSSFGMGEHTKKANAALIGLGATKKVILSDTLTQDYSLEEIEAVLAHEFGHSALHHIPWNLCAGMVVTFAGLYVAFLAYQPMLRWFGFPSPLSFAALPLLFIISSLFSLLTTPVMNYISRRFEYQADQYSVNLTGGRAAFQSALRKLSVQNLADPEPSRLVEWYFYTHPSILKRLQALEAGKQ